MNLYVIRSVFTFGLPDHFPAGWPLHRLTVEFRERDDRGRWKGVPVQGNHAPAAGSKRGVRDTAQTYIDRCRVDVAVAAMIEPSAPPGPYPEGTPMFVEATACIPRPRTTKPIHRMTHVALGGSGRGDGDKMCRFVWDALNVKAESGAAWFADDSMVGEWQGRRVWIDADEPPRIEVAVTPLRASDLIP